ncbi:hypothetical protein MLD38_000812 [Melastoma candidum]|uniref:Uncharacterized protein n=1 Tax=Melastoma candidum TaxID=119954 RepID=A0ACB9SF79_9MYRT|nr:hypothetical protein MLD38_000812 [Melastoma candidum]
METSRTIARLTVLNHLFVSVFIHNFAIFMVNPAITDVTVSALCPGEDECSLAIYLSGFQQAVVGVGSFLVMPLMGNLSDKYGRKAFLTIPMAFTLMPFGILACGRSRNYFYTYYAFKTITAIFCEGTVHCLSLAYVADNVPSGSRVSAFGILSGIGSASSLCGNLSTRFLSTAVTFQVATAVGIVALVYMIIFLPDSAIDSSLLTPIMSQEKSTDSRDDEGTVDSANKHHSFKKVPSLNDTILFVKTSWVFLQLSMVAFFSTLADVGIHAAMLYFLKARFHFDKDQFADIMVITGIAGTISQLIVMPLVAPILGEARLLSIGLFFNCTHMLLYSIAWAPWVPYAAAMLSVFFVFTQPCLRTIVSKQVSSSEQGKAQGCMSGISSLAHVVSPLAFSPLTALFLSDRAPFYFPGFSIMCAGMVSMIAFIQSLMMRNALRVSDLKEF